MTAFIPVAHYGDYLDNADAVVTSNGLPVKTGMYRIINADDRSMHFSWGGAPDASTDALHINVVAGGEVMVKLSTPKKGRVVGATTDATTTVLTFDNHGGGQSHPFEVGDYVTLTGSNNADWTGGTVHAEVTAITNLTVSISLNSSGFTAFDTDYPLSATNSIKISFQGDSSNGLTAHLDEVQVLLG